MNCNHDCQQGRACKCFAATPYRLRDIFLIAAVVLFIVFVTAFLGPSLDDIDADLATQQTIVDAQERAQADLRRDLAAAKLCRLTLGESSFTWTEAGQLVCIPRRGKQVVTTL
jgi:hypothetical protein